MRDVSKLTPGDIADDLVKLHNLPKSDQVTHEALLQEVNGYFQHNINELKQKAAQGQTRDLRGDVDCLFTNVINMTSFDQREGPKADFHKAVIDETVRDGKSFLELDAYQSDRNKIPLCFQISDNVAGLSFTIKTNGEKNADFLYQESMRRHIQFPQQYKTWSQYWGSGGTSQNSPYRPANQQPIRTKSKWES